MLRVNFFRSLLVQSLAIPFAQHRERFTAQWRRVTEL